MKENYYCKFIDFFKRYNLYNKEIFDYIWNRGCFFFYIEEEYHPYIGVYYFFDQKHKLKDFKIIVPYIENEKTVLINIHEYMHAIVAYHRLGKKMRLDNSYEIQPLLFEKLYLLENNDDNLREFSKKLDSSIINSDNYKYKLGTKVAEELVSFYNKDMTLKEIDRKSKKLIKKYKY